MGKQIQKNENIFVNFFYFSIFEAVFYWFLYYFALLNSVQSEEDRASRQSKKRYGERVRELCVCCVLYMCVCVLFIRHK